MNPNDALDLPLQLARWAFWRLQRRLSSVGVTAASQVEVRNFPGPTRAYAFNEVDRFDWRHDYRLDNRLTR